MKKNVFDIKKIFPNIYESYVTLDVGEGWYDLVFNFSKDVQLLVSNWIEKEKKANDPEAVCTCTYVRKEHDHHICMANPCFCEFICTNFTLNIPKISQLKEKFGVLRVYFNFYIDGLQELENKYEELSQHICDECGKLGELKSKGGWLSTRCQKHSN